MAATPIATIQPHYSHMNDLATKKGEREMSIAETLAQTLPLAREKRRISQKKLAEMTGISRSLLSMVEIKERTISLDDLELIAEKLDVSVGFLLTGYEEENRTDSPSALGIPDAALKAIRQMPETQLDILTGLILHPLFLPTLEGYIEGNNELWKAEGVTPAKIAAQRDEVSLGKPGSFATTVRVDDLVRRERERFLTTEILNILRTIRKEHNDHEKS